MAIAYRNVEPDFGGDMSLQSSQRRSTVRELYYITHIKNLPSILRRGILCHRKMVAEGIPFEPIYDEEIVSNRKNIAAPNGEDLWSFANFYFQPRNPMLYRVLLHRPREDIAILGVRRDILGLSKVYVTDGNAASSNSKILPVNPKAIEQIAAQTDEVWWNYVDGKRRIMAECLVADEVPPEHLQAVYVPNHQGAERARTLVGGPIIPVIPQPEWFFLPSKEIRLTPTLSVREGDMFFSGAQTLTISVNCVGKMGKGLASRAKYLFPDVYVYYDDLCRRRALKLGKPYLYRRDISLDLQLADEPTRLPDANAGTWFLLFPTKNHWRDRADIHGIEKGLGLTARDYRDMGIKSLAVPALGCGLGALDWKDVGPILCKYLSRLEIPTWIYLPAERRISEEFLTPEYLLRR